MVREAVEELAELAIEKLRGRFRGHAPADVWPKYVSGADLPPDNAWADMITWLRTDDGKAFGRTRARINVSRDDPFRFLHNQMLRLTPTLVERFFETLPGNHEQRSILRQDLIAHWNKVL